MKNKRVRRSVLGVFLAAAIALTGIAGSAQLTTAQATETSDDTSTDSDEESTEVTMATTELISATVASEKKVTISWYQMDDTDKYIIYGKKKGASTWKKLATVTESDDSSAKRSYTYTSSSSKLSLTWGETYVFTVEAYQSTDDGDVQISENTTGVSVAMKPAKATLKKATSVSYKANKITWKSVTSADGYAVYRKKSGSSSWTKIATVDADTLKYKDTSAKVGITYKYTVKAYWKNSSKTQYGTYDTTGLSVKTKISKPTMKTVKYKNGNVVVRWKKVSGAKGYIVYRKKSGGKWKKVATVKGGSTVKYTDTSVKFGKTYQYKVKAYTKRSGTTYKSDYSKTVKAKLTYTTKTKKVTDSSSGMYGKKIRYYYYSDGTRITDPSEIVGDQDSYYITVNATKNQVIVYAKDGNVYIPLKTFICSTGTATPTGTYHTLVKLRWHELMGPCWGQWCTKVRSDGIYFHSVFYNTYNDNNDLAVSAYNKLGTTCSHGCIRLTAGDAKWIYDNCKIGTTVRIYRKSGYEPLSKPTAYKLSSSHTWDPTDPNMKYKCRKKGCHDV